MPKAFLLLLASGVLFLTGCASQDFGDLEEDNRGPAPYAPDAASHVLPTNPERGFYGG